MDNTQLTTQDIAKAIVVTTSLKIAEEFGKEHKHVLDSIRELIEGFEQDAREIDGPKSGPISKSLYYVELKVYTDSMNRKKPYYELNEAFFMHLVMGYTGEKARKIKTSFIRAFTTMQSELLVRKETRTIGKTIRRSLTDSIQNNVESGTVFKRYAFSNYSKLIYKKVLGALVKTLKEQRGVPTNGNLRDYCTIEELERIQMVESRVAEFLEFTDTLHKSDSEMYDMVKVYLAKTVF